MEGKMDTSLLDRAIQFAVQAHAGTQRRGKGFPYVVHPMEAMAIAATMTDDQEVLAAAALHDVVEDTDVTLDDLRSQFGDRVARLVETESDRSGDGMDWQSRKEDSLRRLKEAGRDEKIVALSDKLSNMRAIARDYHEKGEPSGTCSASRRRPSIPGGITPCLTLFRTSPIRMPSMSSAIL
jgi:(p)ppGpp synthase/HD superfamily hydrolase